MTRVSAQNDGDQLLVALGGAIKAMRQTSGYSQEALANASGIDRSHMGKIERGERNVTFLNIARIANSLNVKPSDILLAAGL